MTRKFRESQLLIATHNQGKLVEFSDLLGNNPVHLSSNRDHRLPEPEETETTFIGNARIKAQAAMMATGLPALADDSGIEIDALSGAPGVFTADWAETENGRDFEIAMRRTWKELEKVDAPAPRTARFCCTLVLIWPDGHEEIFEGTMSGQIVWPMRGEFGHGYDPIFQPDGYETTFGEMDASLKNRISHRADAFAKLVEGCFA